MDISKKGRKKRKEAQSKYYTNEKKSLMYKLAELEELRDELKEDLETTKTRINQVENQINKCNKFIID